MTTADDLKAAIGAWVDEKESNISDLKSSLGSLDATVSALQADVSAEQADIVNLKSEIASLQASVTALTPVPTPPVQDLPPVETGGDPGDAPTQPVVTSFQVVGIKDTPPAADGAAGANVIVPAQYTSIYWKGANGNPQASWFGTKEFTVNADGTVTVVEDHASGQRVTFPQTATLYLGLVSNPVAAYQLWPFTVKPGDLGNTKPSGGSTSGSGTTTPKPPATPPAAPASMDAAAPVDPSRLALRIAIPGSATITFNGSDGVDMKNWTKPSHTQRNVMVQDTVGNRVFFRPDTTSGRMEIVYERGEAFMFPATHLDAYTAEILLDGNVIDTLSIPAHYWLSRWRWQSSWRPFVRTVDDLKAAKIFPANYKPSTKFRQKLPDIVPAYDYMGTSSIVKYMPTTGERNDIGIVPEITGAYLCTGDPGAAYSMRQWAESAASFPVHIRDYKTGKPINWGDYPKANTYYDQRYSNPQVSISPKSPLTWDNAHEPSLSFVMYMLTDDLYYLEELQFFANRSIHASPSYQGMQFDVAQTRGFCWTLRDFFDVVLATPDDIPDTLLPRSYFKAYLDYNRDFVINNYVNNPSPKTAVFYSGVDPLRMPFWQEDYFASVVGLAVYRGFTDWAPVFQWKYKSNIYRTDPAQWPSGCCSSYYPQPAGVISGTTVGNSPLEADVNFVAAEGVWTASWSTDHWVIKNPSGQSDGNVTLRLPAGAQAGSIPFANGDTVTITVTQPKTPMELAAMNGIVAQPEGTMLTNLSEYVQECRYALVMAEILGDTSVKPNLDRLETQMVNSLMPKANFDLYWRWTLERAM